MNNKRLGLIVFLVMSFTLAQAQQGNSSIKFSLAMNNPSEQYYQVTMEVRGISREYVDLKIPVWMPGYYQILNYAENIVDFSAVSEADSTLRWERAGNNIWRVYTRSAPAFSIKYRVKASRNFVATNYLDSTHGFVAPTGTFLHIDGLISHPATLEIRPASGWKSIATGLEKIPGMAFAFRAPDFDVLYDSPLLIGNLDSLPVFYVQDIPHYFIGYKMGQFDKTAFVADLQKITSTAAEMMGDIPFPHYTFIGIGPGAGGIEHLNSAAVSFSGDGLSGQGRIRMLSFLAHEYFHHYNAKRIRPIELGPFDYDRGNRTNMLWVAEGITAYYDELLLRRAGIVTDEELIAAYGASLRAYEHKPGRLFQSVAQASFDTWSDGPFGRTGDDVNKTISYYDKGPILGMLLDFRIRHETKNNKSLDDVMRTLYYEYYKKRNRGYTEKEFQAVCESIAGVSLRDFFDYIYTVKPIDYKKYFAYAGLDIDTQAVAQPGSWFGIAVKPAGDSLVLSSVEWESPAWHAGLRPRQVILSINDRPATTSLVDSLREAKEGTIIKIGLTQQGAARNVYLQPGKKYQPSYRITPIAKPSPLQKIIYQGWMTGRPIKVAGA